LFSKLKSHKLSRKGRPNNDASLTSKGLITSAHVRGHDANPTNTTISSTLEFVLSSLAEASDEQYKSIPDDEIARRGGDHLGAASSATTPPTSSSTAPRGRSSTPTTSMTTSSGTTTTRAMKLRFGDKKKKKFQKTISRACAALINFNFSSDDSSSSGEDEKVKCKKGHFTGLCLIGKSLRNIFDSNSDVHDYLSPDGLSLRVVELENALCHQAKLLCKVFHENKKLNLEIESFVSEIASLRSVHDDMNAKHCDNCKNDLGELC
jgi:hypothetical protein